MKQAVATPFFKDFVAGDRLAKMHGNSRVEPSGYAGLMQRAGLKELVGRGQELGPHPKPDVLQQIQQGSVAFTGPEFPEFVAFSYIAHFAEVRIDPNLPIPHVARYVSVIDSAGSSVGALR